MDLSRRDLGGASLSLVIPNPARGEVFDQPEVLRFNTLLLQFEELPEVTSFLNELDQNKKGNMVPSNALKRSIRQTVEVFIREGKFKDLPTHFVASSNFVDSAMVRLSGPEAHAFWNTLTDTARTRFYPLVQKYLKLLRAHFSANIQI